MSRETYMHYGEPVYRQVISEDFVDWLRRKPGVADIIELPYLPHRVVRYNANGRRRYAVITLLDEAEEVLITDFVPDDGDWSQLVLDIRGQREGNPPKKMPSRIAVLIDKGYKDLTPEPDDIIAAAACGIPAEPDTEWYYQMQVYLGSYGYDFQRLDREYAPDVREDLIRRIMRPEGGE